jgi:hypothetical protein
MVARHRVTVTVPMPDGAFLARQWIVDSLPLPEEMVELHGLPDARIRWAIPSPHPAGPCAICDELMEQSGAGSVSDEVQEDVAAGEPTRIPVAS